MYLCVYVNVCICTCVQVLAEARRGRKVPCSWNSGSCESPGVSPGTQIQIYSKSSESYKSRTISPAPQLSFQVSWRHLPMLPQSCNIIPIKRLLSGVFIPCLFIFIMSRVG